MISAIKIRHAIVAATALIFAATSPATLAQTEESPADGESVAVSVHDVVAEMRVLFEEFQNETRSEMQQQSDEFRDELRQQFLNDRAESLTWWAKSINWWLTFVAIVLTAFGIAVPVALAFKTKKFRHIETEAREAVKKAQDGADKASDAAYKADELVRKIEGHERKTRAIRDNMTGSAKFEQPENIAENLRQHPELKEMISQARALQESGKTENAIRKWRAVANSARETSKSVVAFAWFSVGHLTDKLEDKIYAYSESIHVDPKNLPAFINRGAAKETLERYLDAIEDYDEAIRLDSQCAVAYYNRGAAKAKLGQHESAIADFDEAIRLDPEDFYAYFNRGNAKGALGLFDEARTDLESALKLAKEAGDEKRVARIVVKIREIDNLVTK